jgi:hypothetical protein
MIVSARAFGTGLGVLRQDTEWEPCASCTRDRDKFPGNKKKLAVEKHYPN